MAIHPTAIVSPKAEIGADVEIGPYAIVEGTARIGDRTTVHARAHICDHTSIGEDCEVHPGAILGHVPQDTKFAGKSSYLRIGDRNVFRENSWFHRGSAEGSSTIVGHDNQFMGGSHVAHNCLLGNNITLAPNLLLGGHVHIGDGAYISGNVGIHQFCHVGELAKVDGLSAVNLDVPPYMTVGGRPAAVVGMHTDGMRRAGMTDAEREGIKRAYKLLFRSELDVSQALEQIQAGATTEPERRLVAFVLANRSRQNREGHKRGICRAPRRHHQPGLEAEFDDRLAAEEATTLLGLS